MKIRSPHAEELGFQIAPMCDVLLVLLVFFISITATSALRSDRAIELPVGPNATKKATARSEALINVKWVPEKSAGVVAIESKVITELPAVTEMLAPRSKVDPNYSVVIRADRKTPAQYVVRKFSHLGFSFSSRGCSADWDACSSLAVPELVFLADLRFTPAAAASSSSTLTGSFFAQ